ncbi:hypothetical protein [Methylocystis rosea]|uniref:hypothetical protein n=1 Tax=Methylocystis rosea TaxID=173366 RepID=UPI003CC91D5D
MIQRSASRREQTRGARHNLGDAIAFEGAFAGRGRRGCGALLGRGLGGGLGGGLGEGLGEGLAGPLIARAFGVARGGLVRAGFVEARFLKARFVEAWLCRPRVFARGICSRRLFGGPAQGPIAAGGAGAGISVLFGHGF